VTAKEGLVVGMRSMPGNPYDGDESIDRAGRSRIPRYQRLNDDTADGNELFMAD
jgi:hypothetical protein